MKALIVLGGDAPGVGLLKACAAEADFSIYLLFFSGTGERRY